MGILEYRGVTKRFGRHAALTDVSLEVLSGEVFGLLGPNGAGKTTLIRIGLDILRADEGEVRLFGA
ncbi:MAG: ATP-binding cassette domain-containing protein, partial [Polyangiales bacterium]